jgi:Xaa-Pro aminopeptidase
VPAASPRAVLRLIAVSTALLLSTPAQAQIGAAEYAARRDALTARIDSGVVVAFGGVEPVAYGPTFHQLPGFYYLTPGKPPRPSSSLPGTRSRSAGSAAGLARERPAFYVVPDVQTSDYAAEDSLTMGSRWVAALRSAHPWRVTHSLDRELRRLRARKSAAEIALLRRATEISVRAHRDAMKATATGPATAASWDRGRRRSSCTTWRTAVSCGRSERSSR